MRTTACRSRRSLPCDRSREGRRALKTVGLPAVLKPADSGGQRGVFRLESEDDLDRHLHAALAESAEQECIVEGFVEGIEMNGIVIARGGTAEVVTLSDRLRPPGIGFGVGWIHVYPASAYGDQLALSERVAARAVEVLGLRDGIAFPQLIAHPDGSVAVVEVAARIPGGQMADLVRHATGVDLVDVALRFALGEPVPDEVARPHFQQPLAIRFLTAAPGPLPTGRVTRIGSLEPVLSAEGVVQADTYLQVGETIRPVRLDGDRRGYVIATADTNVAALDRAEAAARLLTVEVERVSCAFDLAHYREIVEAAQAGGYRFAHFDGAPAEGSVILRHDVDLSLDAAVRMAELENDAGAAATYFLMTESVFYNLDSSEGVAAIERLRELGHRVAQHAVYPNAPLDERFDPVVAWHNPDPEYMRAPLPDGRINVMQDPLVRSRHLPLRLEPALALRLPARRSPARRRFPWLQLLTHPEIWAFPGETMGQTMRAMLEAEKARRLQQLADDRIDLG